MFMQQVSKVFLLIAILIVHQQLKAQSSNIKVNQVGYLKHHSKVAWLSNSNASLGANWYVKDVSSGQTMFTSSLSQAPVYDPSSGDTLFKMDFTALDSSGSYYVEVDNVGVSYNFVISDTTYNNLFRDLVRSYYYQRCGFDLTPTYAGIWNRTACHTNDGYVYDGYSGGSIVSGPHVQSTGGWHDAGDFGKKIVPAAMALYHMLKLAELFPATISGVNLNIPADTFSMPDLLNEAKFELDWFFTLQYADGSVSHLLTSPNFYSTGMPENDTQTRYLVPASTAATGAFAAVMAIAAKVYKSYSPVYANLCLTASQNAWAYLQANPQIVPAGGYTVDPPGINNTGTYFDTTDADQRLWAAAELFNTTNDSACRSYFESHYNHWNPVIDYPESWSDVHGYAMYTYSYATAAETTNTIRSTIVSTILNYATNKIKAYSDTTGYGIALTHTDYYWSSNQLAGEYGIDLIRAYLLNPDTTYLEAALSHLNYLLGNNGLNLCFVTGHGTNSTKDPWQAPMVYDGIVAPIPGFVPGGPNQYGGDPTLNAYISANSPAPAKCYLDNHNSYSGNEVCVTYTAPTLFLAGYFYNPNSNAATGFLNSIKSSTIVNLTVYPNPVSSSFQLSGLTYKGTINLSITDQLGRIVYQKNIIASDVVYLPEGTPAGVYVVKLNYGEYSQSAKIVCLPK